MLNRITIEEMERQSILKTKEGLYELGIMKTRRDQEKKELMKKFNKSFGYIFDKNNLKIDDFYEKLKKYNENDWNKLFMNFNIINIYSNKNELNEVFLHFYYLLDFYIKNNKKLLSNYKELEVHKNDIDNEYEECVRNLEEEENKYKLINEEYIKIKEYNIKLINSFNTFKLISCMLTGFIFINNFTFFCNIFSIFNCYYYFYVYFIIKLFIDTDYTLINILLFCFSHFISYRIYQYIGFQIFLKYNKNIFITNHIMEFINPIYKKE